MMGIYCLFTNIFVFLYFMVDIDYINKLLKCLYNNVHIPVFVIVGGALPYELASLINGSTQTVMLVINVDKASDSYIQTLKLLAEKPLVPMILVSSPHHDGGSAMKALRDRCMVFDLTK